MRISMMKLSVVSVKEAVEFLQVGEDFAGAE